MTLYGIYPRHEQTGVTGLFFPTQEWPENKPSDQSVLHLLTHTPADIPWLYVYSFSTTCSSFTYNVDAACPRLLIFTGTNRILSTSGLMPTFSHCAV